MYIMYSDSSVFSTNRTCPTRCPRARKNEYEEKVNEEEDDDDEYTETRRNERNKRGRSSRTGGRVGNRRSERTRVTGEA